MKKLLLITGDLATGKSTFSNVLAKRYQITVFQKDSIKEVLGDYIGFANREENLKLSRATMGLMFYIFEQFTKQGKALILEANFHEEELKRLHEIAGENGYQILTLVLRGDTQLLHKRYCNRMQNENRHPVHLSTTLDQFDDFKEYLEKSRKECIPGDVEYVDASDFSYQTDDKILSRIDHFINGKENFIRK